MTGPEPDGVPSLGPVPLTVPNLLAGVRLAGSPALVALAVQGRGTAFLLLFVFFEATDWLDGKVAVRFHQRTTFGSRLDTLADLVMYAALLAGLWFLRRETIRAEWIWFACALASYVASWVLSFWRFGVLPSYHAWSAKASWFLALVAATTLLTLGWVWPVRIAAAAVTLANVEALLLTARLDHPRSDVRSVFDLGDRDRKAYVPGQDPDRAPKERGGGGAEDG